MYYANTFATINISANGDSVTGYGVSGSAASGWNGQFGTVISTQLHGELTINWKGVFLADGRLAIDIQIVITGGQSFTRSLTVITSLTKFDVENSGNPPAGENGGEGSSNDEEEPSEVFIFLPPDFGMPYAEEDYLGVQVGECVALEWWSDDGDRGRWDT